MLVPLLKASFKSATFFACPGNLNNPSSTKPKSKILHYLGQRDTLFWQKGCGLLPQSLITEVLYKKLMGFKQVTVSTRKPIIAFSSLHWKYILFSEQCYPPFE